MPFNNENRNLNELLEHASYEGLSNKWVSAQDLKKGDKVLLSNGKYGIIIMTETKKLDKPETTYNFEVLDFHTYYVGENGTLVHNMGPGIPCGGDVPDELYHYTNEQGMNGILESNQLNPSLRSVNPKDAFYGDGQYLSDIVPGSKTPAQLARSFKGVPNNYMYNHYVKIDVTGLNVVRGRAGVYVISGNGPLDLTGRIIGFGPV